MQNRRMFLGTAALAGVAATTGGTLLLPATRTHAEGHAHPTDALLEELQRQLVETVRAMTKRVGRPGEHTRRVSSLLRLANAHGVGVGADAALRQQVRREGRQAFLLREPDVDALHAQVKALGLNLVPPLRLNYAERARGLDTLLKRSVSETFGAFAASLERLGAALDRQTTQNVSLRQDACAEWIEALFWAQLYYWAYCSNNAIGTEMLCFWIISTWVALWDGFCTLGCAC